MKEKKPRLGRVSIFPTTEKRKATSFHIGKPFIAMFNKVHATWVIQGKPVSKGYLIERAIELLVGAEEKE